MANNVCPFRLRTKCPFGFTVEDLKEDSEKIKIYCSMCVKSTYAIAKLKYAKRYIVVNTL